MCLTPVWLCLDCRVCSGQSSFLFYEPFTQKQLGTIKATERWVLFFPRLHFPQDHQIPLLGQCFESRYKLDSAT